MKKCKNQCKTQENNKIYFCNCNCCYPLTFNDLINGFSLKRILENIFNILKEFMKFWMLVTIK